jgi:hypothetical protein
MKSAAVTYTLIPLLGLLLGALAAVIRPPGPRVKSVIQHLAAGVVFAAAASEILPGLKHEGTALPIALGGALGVGAMLLVKEAGRRAGGSVGLAAIGAVDILIDGLVLGIRSPAMPARNSQSLPALLRWVEGMGQRQCDQGGLHSAGHLKRSVRCQKRSGSSLRLQSFPGLL